MFSTGDDDDEKNNAKTKTNTKIIMKKKCTPVRTAWPYSNMYGWTLRLRAEKRNDACVLFCVCFFFPFISFCLSRFVCFLYISCSITAIEITWCMHRTSPCCIFCVIAFFLSQTQTDTTHNSHWVFRLFCLAHSSLLVLLSLPLPPSPVDSYAFMIIIYSRSDPK